MYSSTNHIHDYWYASTDDPRRLEQLKRVQLHLVSYLVSYKILMQQSHMLEHLNKLQNHINKQKS